LTRSWLLAAALILGIYVLSYTTFFTNPAGLADSVRALLPWVEKGVQGSGHEKPWPYFFKLLGAFEVTAAVCALAGGLLAVRRRDPFGLFCAVWTASQLAAYSVIPYKTPWLMINMVLPGALTAGVLVREIAQRQPLLPRFMRAGLAALFILGLGWSGWRAADLTFRRYDDASLGLVYSDTNRDVWNLLAFVREAAARAPDPKDVSLAAYASGRWPLPWYLRDLRRTRWLHQVEELPSDDLILADRSQQAALQPLLRRGYHHREFLLRAGVHVDVWVRGGL
jgi:hypothetical protein